MPWTLFVQIVFLFVLAPCLGAQIYACGRAGASLMAPITNAFQAATQALARQRAEGRDKSTDSIAPQIKS